MNQEQLVLSLARPKHFDDARALGFLPSMRRRQAHSHAAATRCRGEIGFDLGASSLLPLRCVAIGNDHRAPRSPNLDLLALDCVWRAIADVHLDKVPAPRQSRIVALPRPKNRAFRFDPPTRCSPREPEA